GARAPVPCGLLGWAAMEDHGVARTLPYSPTVRPPILPDHASRRRPCLGSGVVVPPDLLHGGAAGTELARRPARPALECTGEVRCIRVTEGPRDLSDSRSPVLQHLLGGRAPRPLDDLRVGHPRGPEPSLQGADTRPHRLGDDIDARGAAGPGEQRGDDVLHALSGVASTGVVLR